MRQLGQEDRGLDGIKTAVRPEIRMMMAFEAAVCSNCLHFLGELIVRGEERAAVSVTAEGFGREKTRAGDDGNAAAPLAIPGRPETLGGILDYRNAMLRRDSVDASVIGHLPEQTYRH